MRLKQIKLAGFKSFVEPTKVAFPDPMTAIVGPNGCGKSNIIDAVRWVLGESSAKNLRGDAMTDVIFNGSTSRKPVSLASVELVFDNSDGRLEGQFSSYSEISVKRQVNREGQSFYFLNGGKCRRRDITDLFMGTGLGPRSYAIIEQGTVSRLIESKPQELRVFIEEAAGISRYKERRRETETRIRHTRDNLERLNDIRHELDEQIVKLQAQATTASRYRELKADERRLHGEVLALRWRQADHQSKQLDQQIVNLQGRQQQLQQHQSGDQHRLELLQAQQRTLTADEQQQQQQQLQLTAAISAAEQQQQHQQQRQLQLQAEIEREQQHFANLAQQQQNLQLSQQALEQALQQSAPLQQLLCANEQSLRQQYQLLEQQQEQAEAQRDDARTKREQAQQQQQQLENQTESVQRDIERLTAAQVRASQQLTLLDLATLESAIEVAQFSISDAEQQHQQAQQQVDQLTVEVAAVDQQRLSANDELLQQQQQLSSSLAEQQALTTLLRNRQQALPPELAALPRLWQQLNIEPQWAAVVEALLQQPLQGVISAESPQLSTGVFCFTDAPAPIEVAATSLLNRVRCGYNLAPWLAPIHCADSEAEAQQLLQQLPASQAVVLADGRWFGHGICGLLGDGEQQPLTQLQAQLEQNQLAVSSQQQTVAAGKAQQAQLQQRLTALQQSLKQAQQTQQSSYQQLLSQQGSLDKLTHQLQLAQQQQQQLKQQLSATSEELAKAQGQRQQLTLELQQASVSQTQAQQRWQQRADHLVELRHQLKQQRQKLDDLNQQVQQAQLQQQRDQAQLAALADQLASTQGQSQQLQQRINDAKQQLDDLLAPQPQQRAELQQLRQQQSEQQQQLQQLQQQQAQLDGQVKALLGANRDQQGQQSKLQQQCNKLELQREGLRVQAQGYLDLLAEAQLSLNELLPQLASDATLTLRSSQLSEVKVQIEALGPINLAAIEEFDSQQQRQNYLTAQDSDLREALDMLEGAIRKIDRETKARFKATFDAVNQDLAGLFPKVFGGGSASLELIGDDLLDAGVTIMAQPPGKKNSTIHLLSGGEKALTALSLVFAIFRLNPAPFCLLDEVDAPLDDANVGRFCRLVKEMSETVQFIFISHNKVSMEMADRLTGVTMAEPGCSRIVAVDIEEAAALAQIE
ncbi:chromosome segregation protein SMC [Ferrimonas senticii]|uniref:chromosome segregation protein SMC n=1 Tax=Ferrimonas senticii TaxID=394566 RepID=UPI0003F60A2A|nr:chromosome segregation protein SMC [Ferrimonas senticii]